MDKRLNIVFIPPQNISSEAINLCAQIKKKYEIGFLLDGIKNIPHITIYQLIVPEQNLNILIKTLESLSVNIPPQNFSFTKFTSDFGFLGASFDATEDLKEVQRKIVEKTNNLREGKNILELTEDFAKSKPAPQQKIIKEYGFYNLFDYYDPHITITQLPDFEKSTQLTSELKWEYKSFQSSAIGLYELGEYGTCNKLIKRFNLRAAN